VHVCVCVCGCVDVWMCAYVCTCVHAVCVKCRSMEGRRGLEQGGEAWSEVGVSKGAGKRAAAPHTT